MNGELRRKRRKKWRLGRRLEQDVEEVWGKPSRTGAMPRIVVVACGMLAAAVLVLVVWVVAGSGDTERGAAAASGNDRDDIREGIESAEEAARAFLAETDPEKRLRWVREADEVRARLGEYAPAARNESGEIGRVIGHNESATAFAVKLASGEIRLLEVVETPEGPKVDWDAYARHGTEKWNDLWSGVASQAVVRVFCEPSTEKPEPFADPAEWTGFRLSSPDMGQVALGFAKVGTVREGMMNKVVLGSPKYRQRFVLEVVRHEGKNEPLFEITECRAVGWIEGERSVEESWAGKDGAVAE